MMLGNSILRKIKAIALLHSLHKNKFQAQQTKVKNELLKILEKACINVFTILEQGTDETEHKIQIIKKNIDYLTDYRKIKISVSQKIPSN